MYRDDTIRQSELDTTFGLRKVDDVWKIGNETVKIGPNDKLRIVEGAEFDATPGFWSLVTRKVPRDYTERDLSRYKVLLHETDALYKDYNPDQNYPRSEGSMKWATILRSIWQEFRSSKGFNPDLSYKR